MLFKTVSDDHRRLNLNWDAINAYTGKWKPYTPFEVHITKRQPKKSDPLRKYYWGVVIREFANHLGYEPEDLEFFHRQLKKVYFQTKPDSKGVHRNVPSVFSEKSQITVSDKKKFVDWVVRKAAQEGCYVPDPGE